MALDGVDSFGMMAGWVDNGWRIGRWMDEGMANGWVDRWMGGWVGVNGMRVAGWIAFQAHWAIPSQIYENSKHSRSQRPHCLAIGHCCP